MKNIFIICFSFNVVFGIGLKALIIPQSALTLASSYTGIAHNINVDINPASLSYLSPYMGFSKNNWFGDLEGQKISILKNNSYISFESLSINDIELRDEVASESPIGFFGAYWYSLEYSRSLNLDFLQSNKIDIGYKVKVYLSKLYTESMHGVAINLGLTKKMTNQLSFGFVAKNFGKEYVGDLNAKTPSVFGIGIKYDLNKIPIMILSDLIYQDEEIFKKVSLETKFPYINLICGFTSGDNYKDYSMGVKMDIEDWSFVYATLKHDSDVLGSPTSIELIRKF